MVAERKVPTQDNHLCGCVPLKSYKDLAMRLLTLLCAGMATLALALGYGDQALWAGVGIDIAIGLLWLAGDWRIWDWAAAPCLAGWTGLAAFGAWQGLAAGWMLIAVIAALAAWDLGHFAMHLRDAGAIAQPADLARAHLRQLAIVVVSGTLLGSIALGMRIELTFGWAILAAVLAIIGLSSFIRAGGSDER
jgi:hypothetical protein